MEIKSIEIQNFGSYGNIPQKLDFTNTNQLSYIAAKNGSGKSTLINALVFCLFGKVPELTQGQMVNRINKKKAYVKVEMNVRGHDIIIERGIAPSVFNVTIDGHPRKEAGAATLQAIVENEFIRIPYKLFVNLISISVSEFTSFLSLTPQNKRQIIDKFFGFDIIDNIAKIFKSKRDIVSKELSNVEVVINELNKKMLSLDAKIASLREKNTEQQQQILDDLKITIEEYQIKKAEKEQKRTEFDGKVVGIKDRHDSAKKLMDGLMHKYQNAEKKLKLYENKQCPTCQSSLATDFHVDLQTKLTDEMSEAKDDIKRIREDIRGLSEKLTKASEVRTKLTETINEFVYNLRDAKSKYSAISESVKTNDTVTEFQKLLDSYSHEIEQHNHRLFEQRGELEYFNIAVDVMFSDSGIKKELIKHVVTPLNTLLKKYAKLFSFNIEMSFDNSFNGVLKDLGEEISHKTLSGGESVKANTIIIFSLVELILTQMPTLNVMFFDELFNCLDLENIERSINILKELSTKFNMNIFVVAHTVIERQKFDKIIHVKKTSRFSEIEIEMVE
jgi:DNA repair exonuclease SbcCD ATPase subunit